MRPPVLAGKIERRLLLNYAVDPAAIAAVLPAPFRPQLVKGHAVAGVCLIRLGQMRPKGLPAWVGLRSENAAHRIAVEWDTPTGTRSGVYIPRRDSDSRVNVFLGGRAFPGVHHRARFDVAETEDRVRVSLSAVDGATRVWADVAIVDTLTSRLFDDLDEASGFFRRGCDGYSATRTPARFDGLELVTDAWKVEAASITEAQSSFFDDPMSFPPGSASVDCALVMRKIPVSWKALPSLDATSPATISR